MKDFTVISAKLALICLVAAFALGLVNSVTAPQIEKLKAEQLKIALEKVSSGRPVGAFTSIDATPGILGYYPIGKGESYILRLVAKGYGGDMIVLGTFTKNGRVTNVVLMDNQETPGLGKKAENPEYMEKYLGTGGEGPVPYKKSQLPQAQADAISGATITFSGIGRALDTGSGWVKTMGGSD